MPKGSYPEIKIDSGNLTQQQKDDLELVRESYQASEDWVAAQIDDWNEWIKAYNTYTERPSIEEEGKVARVARPHVFAGVEHGAARTLSAIASTKPIIRVLPKEPNDIKQAELNESLLDYQFENINIEHKLEQVVRNRGIFGFCPIYPYWRYDSHFVKEPTPITIQISSGEELTIGMDEDNLRDREIITFDGFDFDVGDPEDFFPDPSASAFTQQGMRWVIRRYYRSWQWLKKRADYGFIDKKQFMKIDKNMPPPSRTIQSLQTLSNRDFTAGIVDRDDVRKNKGIVEILEYMSHDRIISIANRQCILRGVDNQHPGGEIPCIVTIRLPMTNFPWGRGYIEPIVRTWNVLNSLTNARLQNLANIIRHKWKIRKNAVNKAQLTSNPEQIIELIDMNDLEALDQPDVTQNVYQEEAVLKADMDMALGLNDLARGSNLPNVRSTGQTLALLETLAERTQLDVRSFIDTGLIPLAKYAHRLNQKLLSQETVIRITGQEGFEWIRVKPDDIMRDFDFKVESTVRTVPKAIEAEQLLNLLGALNPLFAGFEDMLISLYAKATRKMGQLELSTALDLMAQEMSQQRQAQGGVFQREGTNGQGGGGTGGARVARDNQPQLENIVRSVSNSLGGL